MLLCSFLATDKSLFRLCGRNCSTCKSIFSIVYQQALPPGYRTDDDAEDPVLSVAQFAPKGYNGLYMPFLGLDKAVPNDGALGEALQSLRQHNRGLPVLKVASLHTTTPVPVDRHKEPYHCGRKRWGVWYLGAGVDASENTSGRCRRKTLRVCGTASCLLADARMVAWLWA